MATMPEASKPNGRPWAMNKSPGDEEASKDPAARQPGHVLTDQDISGHRHLYVGFHLPGKRHGHGHKDAKDTKDTEKAGDSNKNGPVKKSKKSIQQEPARPATPPAQRVQFILGEENRTDTALQSHPLFSEMEELFVGEDGNMEWKETARWVKFEEDVEEGGNRWSKPHVATLSLHSLFQLRALLTSGSVILDMSATSLEEIADIAIESLVNNGSLPWDKREQVKDAILKKHRHQFEGLRKKENTEGGNMTNNMTKLPIIRSLADIGRTASSKSMSTNMKKVFKSTKSSPALILEPIKEINSDGSAALQQNSSEDSLSDEAIPRSESSQQLEHKTNLNFMKKIPKGAEASNILVGEVDFLDKPLPAFIRLQEATILGDLTEVPVPTRFLFFLLGPLGGLQGYHEIGRAVATVLSDDVFHDVAYKAQKRDHLLAGLDEFLDAVTVLPPGEWDPAIRIEPPSVVPSQEGRKNPNKMVKEVDEEEEERKIREEAGLTRTGRLFGGLINDIKRKAPWYLSDYKDALSLQCLASYFFLYFACLTPIITFGGLLGDATKNNMASMESLVSGMIVGVLYGLFSGQPLTIMGSTGPVLVVETIVFDFCRSQGWDYLSFRLWIGIWIGVILLLLVAFDASAFVCYITRFTEENFATLIAVIFIIKALEKVLAIGEKYPLHPSACYCQPDQPELLPGWNQSYSLLEPGENSSVGHKAKQACSFLFTVNETFVDEIHGHESVGCHYVPNAFLMSCLLFIGTFLIALNLKNFKTGSLFPTVVRQYISDFAVVIAIASMTLTDALLGVDTPKLSVPDKFAPTLPDRGWLVPIMHELNPWWTSLIAIVPAILGSILIFMDQQITAVIVNRKEHKLEKGGGYHLDLLIVAICIIINSFLGIPWFVAATVLSINHVRSLSKDSECAAPGEKPQFLGIREQRLTHIMIFITVGLSVFMTPVLCKIPMPVLYGVFLYMGIASLNGLQFFDRIFLFFMPKKYQPDYPYLRQVPLSRVHLFTLIQIACFISLWLVKSFQQTSILFPIMLVVMIGIRKSLDFVFTKKELQVLDDILPEFKRQHRLDDEEALQQETDGDEKKINGLHVTKSSVEVAMSNGNVLHIPQGAKFNITEEMNRSGCWTSLEPSHNTTNSNSNKSGMKKRKGRKMSLVEEGEDEGGITIKADKKKRSGDEEKGATEEEKASLVYKRTDAIA